MSYVIFGRRDQLGRVASRPTVEAALAEVCCMERGGFTDLELIRQFHEATPAGLFAARNPRPAHAVCGACGETCEKRQAA